MKLYDLFYKVLNAKFTHTSTGADYSFTKEDGVLYILFEETMDAQDKRLNLQARAVEYNHLGVSWKCHRGFLQNWLSIEPELRKIIYDTDFQSVIISGYSHGAALSVFAHEYVWLVRPDLRNSLYTYAFEGPRVVNGALPSKLDACWNNFYLIRNGKDIITHLPPKCLGYKHVGQIIEIGQNTPMKYTFSAPNWIQKNAKLNQLYHIITKSYNYHYYLNIADALKEYDKSKE